MWSINYTSTIALNIRNSKAENLAAELAKEAGKTKTEAVAKALKDRFVRVRDEAVHHLLTFFRLPCGPGT